jgi:hypothetical protein
MNKDIVKRFFKYGYFSEILPPWFTTEHIDDDIIDAFCDHLEEWDPIKKGRHKRPPSYPIYFTGPKNGQDRRKFSIVHPLHYVRLAHTISELWDEITTFSEQSLFSTSPLRLDKKHKNKIFEHRPFRYSVQERIERSAGKRWALIMDISNFFDSIYTHYIPLALNGLRTYGAKGYDRTISGVCLDQDVRIGRESQTNGIVVGPATSRVISEIIASYLDLTINKADTSVTGIRYVDDYTLYFDNLSSLEKTKGSFEHELSKLGLSLNNAKTKVLQVPETFEKPWVRILRLQELRTDKAKTQRHDLITHFNYAFNIVKNDPSEYALKYFLSKVSNIKVLPDAQSIFVDLLLHSGMLDLKVIPQVVEILLALDLTRKQRNNIRQFVNNFLGNGIQRSLSQEMQWILYLCYQLGLPLKKKICNNIILLDDQLLQISVGIAAEKTSFSSDMHRHLSSRLEIGSEAEGVRETNELWLKGSWLLAYTGYIRGWDGFEDLWLQPEWQFWADHEVEFVAPEKRRSTTTNGYLEVNGPAKDILDIIEESSQDDLTEEFVEN